MIRDEGKSIIRDCQVKEAKIEIAIQLSEQSL
jgi:hypothetical protein